MGKLVELLKNEYAPISVYHTLERPEGSESPAESEHCAIRAFFRPAMFEHRSICAKRDGVRCLGAVSGLAVGAEDDRDMLPGMYSDRTPYFDSQERCRRNYIDLLPPRGDAEHYVVFEPLERTLSRGVEPEVVIFLVDPTHLAALTYLAGYDREDTEPPVVLRYALSCEQMVLMPILEGEKQNPKAVIGMTELSTRSMVDMDKLTFSIPYKLFRKMDTNAERSFLAVNPWKKITE